MAILIAEYLKENNINADYKIFATDVDKDSIQHAAEGRYPVNYVADIPKSYLDSYFIKNGDSFEISKKIREKIVFSRHNLLKDPPFIKIDFISCRNLLIYLLPKVQYKVIGTFLFGLNKGGFLFLGHSETLGDSQKMFRVIDPKWRIYENTSEYKELPSRLQTDLRLKNYENTHTTFGYEKNLLSSKLNSEKFYAEMIATAFGPSCVFLNSSFEILYVNGDINDYVEFPKGIPRFNFIDILVDDKLRAMVRNGIRRSQNDEKKIVFKDIPFENKRQKNIVTLTFQSIKLEPLSEKSVLISFEKRSNQTNSDEFIVYDQYKLDEFSKQRIEDLEAELKKIKQELQNSIEELETSNEELQASNEELQASNEELQSTNEELQSVNEELYTVNAEVQVKNKELIDLNDDVTNILDSTDIGILFLDTDLRIRKFTPALKMQFSLTNNDLGRPISNFASNFTDKIRKELIADAKTVLENGKIIEKELVDDTNRYFLKKIAPFKSSRDQITGVVISFVEITTLVVAGQKLDSANIKLRKNKFDLLQAQKIAHIGSWFLNIETNEVEWTEELYKMYELDPSLPPPPFTEHMKLFTPESWEILSKSLDKTAKTGEPYELELKTIKGDNTHGWMWVRGEAVKGENDKITALWGAAQDITERKRIQETLQSAKTRLELATKAADIGIWIWDLDSNLLTWDERLLELYQVPDSVKSSGLYYEFWRSRCHPNDIVRAEAELNAAIRGEKNYDSHFRIILPDNSVRYIQSSATLDFDETGKPFRFVGINRDLTTIKEAESVIQLSEERFRSLVMATAQIVWNTNSNGEVVNDLPTWRAFTGQNAEAIKGWGWLIAIHPDDRKHTEIAWTNSVRTKCLYEVEYRIRRFDGEFCNFIARGNPVLNPDGTVREWVGTCTDITERKKNEAIIQEVVELNHQIINSSSLGIFSCKESGSAVFANEAVAKISGAPLETMLSLNFHNLPRWKENGIYDKVLLALQTGKEQHFETKITSSFGKVIWANFHITTFISSGEKHFLMMIEDVTERTLNQLELQNSEKRFSSAFEYASIGMALVSTHGSWLKVNNALCNILGYGADELMSKTFQDITHPDDLNIDLTYVDQMLNGELQTYHVEKRYFHSRGNIVWVLLGVSLVRDNQGFPLYFVLQIQDITQQKNFQIELKESESRYKNLFNESRSVMLLIDPENGKIVDANQAASDYYGYSHEKLISMNINEINILAEADIKTEMRKAIDKNIPYFQFTHKLANNTQRHVQVYSGKINIDKKSLLYSIIHDNTAEIEAIEKIKQQTAILIQSEKMNAIGTLTAGVAHELNNPLMGILNYAAYCKENIEVNSKLYPVLNDLIEEAERSAEIVKSLLTFTRKDENTLTENFRTNIIDGISDCLKLLTLKTKSKGINITLNYPNKDVYGNIKPSYLQQIIYNLVDNAVFAVENCKNKTIEISVDEEKDFHVVKIHDKGIGISADKIKSIFDPFFTTKPVGLGTGLGLSICKNMIEESKGKITFDSIEKKGTTFNIHITKTQDK